MEAACVRAELRYRDGQSQSFSIRPGGGGLGALRAAISELNLKASQLLSELVDSERERAGSARGELQFFSFLSFELQGARQEPVKI